MLHLPSRSEVVHESRPGAAVGLLRRARRCGVLTKRLRSCVKSSNARAS